MQSTNQNTEQISHDAIDAQLGTFAELYRVMGVIREYNTDTTHADSNTRWRD